MYFICLVFIGKIRDNDGIFRAFENEKVDDKPIRKGSKVSIIIRASQGLVKGVKLCLNPYFFGWLEN